MHLRHDALAAAAEWIAAVETTARDEDGLVATVGKIDLKPNAGNVVPGQVDLSLDLRHMKDATRHHWAKHLAAAAQLAARKRGVEVEWTLKLDQAAVELDPYLSSQLDAALEDAGFPPMQMPSGAGHDAMIMAARVPTAMLFLRSPGGISHHPDEAVREDDVEASLLVARKFLERLAAGLG
jgi:allantoate deiminase